MNFLKSFLLLVSLVLSGVAQAETASPWAGQDNGRVRLLSAATAVGTAQQVQLGLHFQLADGWKIYWRSPGDAGFPPSIDWAGSRNLASGEIKWPAPHRFELSGLQTAGYGGDVVLPIIATVQQPGQPLTFKAGVDYLVCNVVCVPGRADLSLAVPAGPGGSSEHLHAISRALSAVPGDGTRHGLTLVGAEADDESLRVVVVADPPLAKPDLFVEGAGNLSFGAPAVSLRDGGREVVLTAKASPPASVAGKPLTITVVDGNRAMEAAVSPTVAVSRGVGGGLLPMLGLALLGGLILNLMPCVLPVLSLKLLSVLGHGSERRAVRRGFLATAAGVVVSFLVLAALAVAVKAAGQAVGWGIQFQQPLFLIALVLLLTLFAANLWGAFEVPLPGFLGSWAAKGEHGGSLGGSFASGVFATILATPCSAPFLGTAVGFALARGPVEIVAIFTALGLGMVLPYLLIAAVPGLARKLPRPGAWMLTLKRVLGLALVATAVWLLAVLAVQVGLVAAVVIGLLMLLVLGGLFLKGRLGHAAGAAALTAGLLAFAVPAAMPAGAAIDAVPDTSAWRSFERASIARLVGEGRVVFVDITADWCITCQVNKATVLKRSPVSEALIQVGVVPMRGDWTKPDAAIAAYLAEHGRYGIPFNAIYGPGAPNGIVLPEILTDDAVLDALKKAKG